MQLFDGESDTIVRGASAPVIALWQGEGASSDGGSSTHEAAPRSELLVSSDGSSYAAPSAGLAPDTRIACVSDNAIVCATRKCARDRIVAGRGRLVRRRLNKKTTMPVSSLVKRKIVPARGNRALSESRRVKKRTSYAASTIENQSNVIGGAELAARWRRAWCFVIKGP